MERGELRSARKEGGEGSISEAWWREDENVVLLGSYWSASVRRLSKDGIIAQGGTATC